MSDASAGTGSGTGRGTGEDPFTRFVRDVDFPGFVEDLLRGVYNAILGTSIVQMEAFGKLVKNVADAVEEYVDDVARTGAGCLDGLCSSRARAGAGARPEPPSETATTESGSDRES